MSTEERIVFLTEQIRILKSHDWPGIESEIEDKRAELRQLLVGPQIPTGHHTA